MTLSRRDQFGLELQRALGWLFFPLWAGLSVGLMRFGAGYRIPDLRAFRKRVQALLEGHDGPLFVCANHLTLIDSALVEWALCSNWAYWRRFARFPWSMPERRNYAGNPALRLMCYLGKCVPVVRGGSPEETKRTLDKFRYLMHRGEALFIFPEGTRSRSGRVDAENYGYGVGRLLAECPGAPVLCVYLRGREQARAGSVPKRGERFYVAAELLTPTSEQRGLRAARELSGQVIAKLVEMERRYFASYGAGGQ